MIKFFIPALAICMLAFGATAAAQDGSIEEHISSNPMAPDPGIPDTVRVETKTVPATDSFTVDVFLYNDEELGGLAIPLKWGSPDFELDTVTFLGSRLDYIGTRPINIDNPNQQVLVGAIVIFEAYIQPGSGLAFTMHFRAKPGIADQVFDIDTSFFPPSSDLALTLSTGFNISPQFAAGEITWGEPQPEPTIELSPSSFAFTAVEGGANPASQSLSITNIGDGTLTWTATKTSDWLTVTPASGTGDGSVALEVDITGLTAGTYYDTVVVSDPAATNSPQRAPVTLVVEEPPPTITLSPSAFSYTITEGDNLPNDQLSITNTGGQTLDWTASNLTAWLTLSPTGGTGDGTVTLLFDVGALAPGTYYDTITVTDPAATNSPQEASVTLTVTEAPPLIGVAPDQLFFSAGIGDPNPPARTVTITNLGGGVLNWTIQETAGWLTVSPESGTGDGAISVSADITGLSEGTYAESISVIDPAAANSPQVVEVTMVISDLAVGSAQITPEEQHLLRAYALDPKTNVIHIGNFGAYQVTDIDQATVVANDSIVPSAINIVPSHPDFAGEVMLLDIFAYDFILSYGPLFDTTVYEFTVTGLMTDAQPFTATGEVTLIGLLVGDVDGDGAVNVGDVNRIVGYIFRESPLAMPDAVGDVDHDGGVNVGDAVYLINYIFRNGPAPIQP